MLPVNSSDAMRKIPFIFKILCYYFPIFLCFRKLKSKTKYFISIVFFLYVLCNSFFLQEIPNESEELSDANAKDPKSPDIHHNHLDTESTPNTPKLTKKIKSLADEVLMSVKDHFKRPRIEEDRLDFYAKNIAMKLREITEDQRIIAEKIINDTLFLSETGSLTLSHSVKGSEFMNTTYSPQAVMSTQVHYEDDVNHFQSSPTYPHVVTPQSTFSRPSSQQSASSYLSNFSA